ncbi:hypothetical protein Q9295_09910 [Xinfangfangia sp. CPCC 101601]|uniref:Anti-sigma factor NepR domain-containing protein n=1 Tax=Pseudogemmobacter lacusdianii TaxID=3069608 RepID=A0ABU0VY71_9RHOB|nr:hypothetical protein [Xinfangfangia sp. CPCC 101601]MDQ2066691.1 hypothetical protein [Xinfangfangia sp. CPCC 101601]
MSPQVSRLEAPAVDAFELLRRAMAGLFDGLMPCARLEALIDHLEMRK